jgi:hypothetical protein
MCNMAHTEHALKPFYLQPLICLFVFSQLSFSADFICNFLEVSFISFIIKVLIFVDKVSLTAYINGILT